ncbi:GCN5 family acetyltransferase [Arthrobacter sp. RIT-PI-e]|uniref:GNAT family N-acetyltransferase n=1 Tax=Arthrobacter sp. RIT-PI-e TaxID=1681197 RepID=UPI000676323A|nr:GNAT family protein [Arthrobacter sp. RIT-PI-e]KNC20127.1 GCN5 family acetyltransferase [Arthrobacter sp. RIT-PI-e]
MSATAPFREQRTLLTERLRLEPLGPEHFDGMWEGLQDEEVRRLTGTHAVFTREQIADHLGSRAAAHDRADWAIIRLEDDAFLGEIVLNDLDADNRSLGMRMNLNSAPLFGRGYGTEALRAVIVHAFDDVGVHRISLEVFAFNPRAQRVYEKCGFTVEGRQREALFWDGTWHDVILMGILSTDPRYVGGG